LTQHVAATSLGRRPGNPVADAALPASSTLSGSAAYDLVLAGGRVIDPESGTDAVLNIGIVGGRIVALGGADVVCPADAAQVRDCAGLIVAPGFIDLCEHPPPPPPLLPHPPQLSPVVCAATPTARTTSQHGSRLRMASQHTWSWRSAPGPWRSSYASGERNARAQPRTAPRAHLARPPCVDVRFVSPQGGARRGDQLRQLSGAHPRAGGSDAGRRGHAILRGGGPVLHARD
jgi:hypothetical protein